MLLLQWVTVGQLQWCLWCGMNAAMSRIRYVSRSSNFLINASGKLISLLCEPQDLTTLIPVHAVSPVIKFYQSVNDGVVDLSLQFSFLTNFFHPQCTRYGSASSVAPPRFVFQIFRSKSWSTPSLAFVFQPIFLPRKDLITFKKWFIWSWVYSQQMEDVGVRTESPNPL